MKTPEELLKAIKELVLANDMEIRDNDRELQTHLVNKLINIAIRHSKHLTLSEDFRPRCKWFTQQTFGAPALRRRDNTLRTHAELDTWVTLTFSVPIEISEAQFNFILDNVSSDIDSYIKSLEPFNTCKLEDEL